MLRRRWFIFRRKDRRGPFTAAQLQKLIADGRVKPTDLVQKGDTSTAVTAAQVDESLAPSAGVEVADAPTKHPLQRSPTKPECDEENLAFTADSLAQRRPRRNDSTRLVMAAGGLLVLLAVVVLVVAVSGRARDKGQPTRTDNRDTALIDKEKAKQPASQGSRLPGQQPGPKKAPTAPTKGDGTSHPSPPHPIVDGDTDPEVKFETSVGVMTIRLMPKAAPLTVATFLANVDAGAFDGTLVDSVHYTGAAKTPRFLLCGRFRPGMEKTGAKAPEKNEWSEDGPPCVRSVVTAEHGWQMPDDVKAAFRIHVRDDSRDESVAGKYCVFGKVIAGMDAADRIAAVETRFETQWSVSMPVKEIRIIRISRVTE